MRLNLIIDPKDYLADYINVCPNAKFEDKNVVYGDITELSLHADDGEADEVRALNILEYYKLADVNALLDRWISKVKIGGLLTVGGTELTLLCKAGVNREVSFEELNNLLYGGNPPKSCTLNSLYVRGILEQKNLKIKLHRIEGYKFVVQAERKPL